LEKYPSLYWKTKYSPCFVRQDEDIIIAGTHEARTKAFKDAYIKREKAMGVFPSSRSVYRDFVEIINLQSIGQLKFFPASLKTLSGTQVQEITLWNVRVFMRMQQMPYIDFLPILPIQMIWYMGKANPRYYGYSEERWSDTPIAFLLKEKTIPSEVLDCLVYHPSYWVRKCVIDNKKCSEENRTIGAILNLGEHSNLPVTYPFAFR
jgi:hypothetical protein